MQWLKRNAAALQAGGAVITALAALAALIGVKVQIDASAQLQREQAARDIYREFLSLSISRTDLADPDYCALAASDRAVAYENYVEYLLYTSEQMLASSSQWEATLIDHLDAHREMLCRPADWSDDSSAVQSLIKRYQAARCKGFVPACDP